MCVYVCESDTDGEFTILTAPHRREYTWYRRLHVCRVQRLRPAQLDTTAWRHWSVSSLTILHAVSKKQYTWLLIITSENADRLTKFFHRQIPDEILYTDIFKILHLTLSMFIHYLVKLDSVAADFNGILHVRPQNSSCKIRGRLNSSGLNLWL